MCPGGSQWVEGNWSSESGEGAILQLLDKYPDMDAVFVANDQMALSVLQVANRRRLRVPQDLAVVGFDAMPEAAYFCPPLTTVRQNLHELGSIAAKQVIHMIEVSREPENSYEPESVWLKPELIVRESSVASQ